MPAFSPSPWAEGLRRALPIVLGYLPVGFAFGVLAVKNNIPPGLTVAMSVLMFSGSGQFVFAAMWGAGAGILSIIAAVGIVNLRYLLQSAAQSPWMTGLPRAQRFLLGLGLTDTAAVLRSIDKLEKIGPERVAEELQSEAGASAEAAAAALELAQIRTEDASFVEQVRELAAKYSVEH